MADDTEVIRKQMEETRSHLAEKLEELENQVSETVQATTEAVSETVGTVKETVENVTATVQETFETVAETFNLKVQTERHPWLVVGASIAGGCLLAQLIPSQAATRGGETLSGNAGRLRKSQRHHRGKQHRVPRNQEDRAPQAEQGAGSGRK